jgi:hypothetical protein
MRLHLLLEFRSCTHWGVGANPSGTRREEDIAAVQSVGAEYIHGDLHDALYRTDPDGKALYPTTQAIFSAPSPKETVWLPLRRLSTNGSPSLRRASSCVP